MELSPPAPAPSAAAVTATSSLAIATSSASLAALMREETDRCPLGNDLVAACERAGRRLLARPASSTRGVAHMEALTDLSLHLRQRHIDLAVKCMQWGVAVAERAGNPSLPVEGAVAMVPLKDVLLGALAHNLREAGQLEAAEATGTLALEGAQRGYGARSMNAARAHEQLARTLHRMEGRLEDAEAHVREADAIVVDLDPVSMTRTLTSHLSGKVLVDLGRTAEAVPHLQTALRLASSGLVANACCESPGETLRDAAYLLAGAASEEGLHDICVHACESALAAPCICIGKREYVLGLQAASLASLGRWEGSLIAASRAYEICTPFFALGAPESFKSVTHLYTCGVAALELGRLHSAEVFARRGLLLAARAEREGWGESLGWYFQPLDEAEEAEEGPAAILVREMRDLLARVCDRRDEEGGWDRARTARMRRALLAGRVPDRACAICEAPPAHPMGRCSACGLVSFCSEACQARHWDEGGHREECPRWRLSAA